MDESEEAAPSAGETEHWPSALKRALTPVYSQKDGNKHGEELHSEEDADAAQALNKVSRFVTEPDKVRRPAICRSETKIDVLVWLEVVEANNTGECLEYLKSIGRHIDVCKGQMRKDLADDDLAHEHGEHASEKAAEDELRDENWLSCLLAVLNLLLCEEVVCLGRYFNNWSVIVR